MSETDIVARLRDLKNAMNECGFTGISAVTNAAADEIERLQAENATLRKQLDQFVGEFHDEVQREAL